MKQIYKTANEICGRAQNRLWISMLTGITVISLICGIPGIISQKNVSAWWGSIYPEFCFSELIRDEKCDEKIPSEQSPKISFWLAKAIERW